MMGEAIREDGKGRTVGGGSGETDRQKMDAKSRSQQPLKTLGDRSLPTVPNQALRELKRRYFSAAHNPSMPLPVSESMQKLKKTSSVD